MPAEARPHTFTAYCADCNEGLPEVQTEDYHDAEEWADQHNLDQHPPTE